MEERERGTSGLWSQRIHPFLKNEKVTNAKIYGSAALQSVVKNTDLIDLVYGE